MPSITKKIGREVYPGSSYPVMLSGVTKSFFLAGLIVFGEVHCDSAHGAQVLRGVALTGLLVIFS
jgi:hypothetical protein